HPVRARALPAQRRGRRVRRAHAVPGRPHPSQRESAAATARQRLARVAQAAARLEVARRVRLGAAQKKPPRAWAGGGFSGGVGATGQPFLVGRSGTVGGSRSSEATSVSGSPGASPSLLGLSLRFAFS